jgi:hypothetical protein
MSFETVVNALPYLSCVSVLPRLFDAAILAVIMMWGAVVWRSKRMGSEETGWKPVFLRWQVKKQAGSLFAGTGWKPVFPIMMTLSVVGCSR